MKTNVTHLNSSALTSINTCINILWSESKRHYFNKIMTTICSIH